MVAVDIEEGAAVKMGSLVSVCCKDSRMEKIKINRET